MDYVFHLAGGRTLADASVSYEEMTDQPETNPEETGETTETEVLP